MTHTDREEWYPIPDYPKYEISNHGRIRKLPQIMAQSPSNTGYLTVRLSNGNGAKTIVIHRLMARIFHGQPSSPGLYVNHMDHDRQNNRADNLEWCTPSQNVRHGMASVGGSAVTPAKLKP